MFFAPATDSNLEKENLQEVRIDCVTEFTVTRQAFPVNGGVGDGDDILAPESFNLPTVYPSS